MSVTRTVMAYCPGPCASVGVQVKAPVNSSIIAPVAFGVPSKTENDGVCPTSGSVAVAVKLNCDCSSTVLFPIGDNTTARFDPGAVTVMNVTA